MQKTFFIYYKYLHLRDEDCTFKNYILNIFIEL